MEKTDAVPDGSLDGGGARGDGRVNDAQRPERTIVRTGPSLVGRGAGRLAALGGDVRQSRRAGQHPEPRRRGADGPPPLLRIAGRQRQGLRDLSPAIQCHERLGGEPSRALAGEAGQVSGVRRGGWLELPRPAAGGQELAFVAPGPGTVPHRTALAAADGGGCLRAGGISHRGDARSDRLQYQPRLRLWRAPIRPSRSIEGRGWRPTSTP